MQNQRGFVSAALLIAIVLGLIVVGGGAYYVVHQQSPSQTASENLDNLQALPLSTTSGNQPSPQGTDSSQKIPLLTFIYPKANAQLSYAGANISWQLTDPSLVNTFPPKDTYISFHVLDSSGKDIGSAGDGYTLEKTSTAWNIAGYLNQKFYTLSEGAQYHLKATLSYEPRDFTCDPKVKGECSPIYSTTEQALREKAARYESESTPFTVDLSGYISPAATIDSGSSLSGTAKGFGSIKLQMWPIGKDETIVPGSKIYNESVRVLNSRWQYDTSSLPSGIYHVNIWGADGSSSLGGGTFVAVSGMKNYTDSDFGFSFWYPSSWSVNTGNAQYGNTTVKRLGIYPLNQPDLGVYLDEVIPSDRSIGVGNSAKSGMVEKYYFDASAHTWMYSHTDESGIQGDKVFTGPANVSTNTMGGLHMFTGAGTFGENIAVPLSATRFVVSEVTGENNPLQLVKTIVATDPSVATPVSASQQREIIQAEKDDYCSLGPNPSCLSASPLSGHAPLTVNFTAVPSAGDETMIFGDGHTTDSPEYGCSPQAEGCSIGTHVSHVYTSPGTYTVLLYRHLPSIQIGSVTITVTQ